MRENVLAIDLGASSGRVIIVSLQNEKLQLNEIHRFVNEPVKKRGILSWDIESLFEEIVVGVRKALVDNNVLSLGVDTWGVDFGLLNEFGELVSLPTHYRDTRTKGMLEKVSTIVDMSELYEETGNQIMEINTLFQILAMKESKPEDFYQAKKLLLMPSLFNYMLTGEIATEASIASTTQLTNPYTKDWSKKILTSFDLPEWLFPKIEKEGTILGQVKPELGLGNLQVVNVCQHDTASAVVSVPADQEFLFISCGTWSLIGTEIQSPVLNEAAQSFNLTNESGNNGTTRLLKNCTGLWIVQELKRNYEEAGCDYSYKQITQLAKEIKGNHCIIDTDDEMFSKPGDIRERIQSYAKRTNQHIPSTPGEFFKCAYESLAYKYNETIHEIEQTIGREFCTIHMIGGGSQAEILCQLVADITRKEVIAGPVEATAIGNGVIQLIANKKIESVAKAREIIKESFELQTYQPNGKKNIEMRE